jgi:hypothetical protein
MKTLALEHRIVSEKKQAQIQRFQKELLNLKRSVESTDSSERTSGEVGTALASYLMYTINFGLQTAIRAPSSISNVFETDEDTLIESAANCTAAGNGTYVRSTYKHPQRNIYKYIVSSLVNESRILQQHTTYLEKRKLQLTEEIRQSDHAKLQPMLEAIKTTLEEKEQLLNNEMSALCDDQDSSKMIEQLKKNLVTLEEAYPTKRDFKKLITEINARQYPTEEEKEKEKKTLITNKQIEDQKISELKKKISTLERLQSTIKDTQAEIQQIDRIKADNHQTMQYLTTGKIIQYRSVMQNSTEGNSEEKLTNLQSLIKEQELVEELTSELKGFYQNKDSSINSALEDIRKQASESNGQEFWNIPENLQQASIKLSELQQKDRQQFQKKLEKLKNLVKEPKGLSTPLKTLLSIIEKSVTNDLFNKFSSYAGGTRASWNGSLMPPQVIVEDFFATLTYNEAITLANDIISKFKTECEQLTQSKKDVKSKEEEGLSTEEVSVTITEEASKEQPNQAEKPSSSMASTEESPDNLIEMIVPNDYPAILFIYGRFIEKLANGVKLSQSATNSCNHILLSYFCGLVNKLSVDKHGANGALEMQPQASFGSLRPQITDTGDSFRCSLGIAPEEYADIIINAYHVLNQQLAIFCENKINLDNLRQLIDDKKNKNFSHIIKQNSNRNLINEWVMSTEDKGFKQLVSAMIEHTNNCKDMETEASKKGKKGKKALKDKVKELSNNVITPASIKPTYTRSKVKATMKGIEANSILLNLYHGQMKVHEEQSGQANQAGLQAIEEVNKTQSFTHALSLLEINHQVLVQNQCIIKLRKRFKSHTQVKNDAQETDSEALLIRLKSMDRAQSSEEGQNIQVRSLSLTSGMQSCMTILGEALPVHISDIDSGDYANMRGRMYFEIEPHLKNEMFIDAYQASQGTFEPTKKCANDSESSTRTNRIMTCEFAPMCTTDEIKDNHLDSILADLAQKKINIPEIIIMDTTCVQKQDHEEMIEQFKKRHKNAEPQSQNIQKPYAIITYCSDNKTAVPFSFTSGGKCRIITLSKEILGRSKDEMMRNLHDLVEWFENAQQQQEYNSTSLKVSNEVHDLYGLLCRTGKITGATFFDKIEKQASLKEITLRNQLDDARSQPIKHLKEYLSKQNVTSEHTPPGSSSRM